MLDDDFNSAFWDNLQEEMKKVSESDVDPSQLWIDEFNSYYNTTTKVNILNFNNKILSVVSNVIKLFNKNRVTPNLYHIGWIRFLTTTKIFLFFDLICFSII